MYPLTFDPSISPATRFFDEDLSQGDQDDMEHELNWQSLLDAIHPAVTAELEREKQEAADERHRRRVNEVKATYRFRKVRKSSGELMGICSHPVEAKRTYSLYHNGAGWACGCAAYTATGKPCKHLHAWFQVREGLSIEQEPAIEARPSVQVSRAYQPEMQRAYAPGEW